MAILHNARPNLRAADAAWNQSIQENFDPCEWVHYNAASAIDCTHAGAAPAGTPWPGALPAPALPQQAFYLYNQADCAQISCLAQIGFTVQTALSIIANTETVNLLRPFVFSSNNLFPLQPQALAAGDPVYFCNTLNLNTWTDLVKDDLIFQQVLTGAEGSRIFNTHLKLIILILHNKNYAKSIVTIIF